MAFDSTRIISCSCSDHLGEFFMERIRIIQASPSWNNFHYRILDDIPDLSRK